MKAIPDTLLVAVTEGLKDGFDNSKSYDGILLRIRDSVRDSLASEFGSAMLKADRMICTKEVLDELWFKITGERLK